MKPTLLAFVLFAISPPVNPAVTPVEVPKGDPSGIVKVVPPVMTPYTVSFTTKPKLPVKTGYSMWTINGLKPAGLKWTSRDKNSASFTLPYDTQPCTIDVTWTGIDTANGEQYTADLLATIGPAPLPPGPVPPVVPPADPDFLKVQSAYLSDSPLDPMQRKTAANTLVRYYRDAGTACRASVSATAGPFFKEIEALPSSSAVGVVLPKTRAVVAEHLRVVFPPPTMDNMPVADAQRKALAAVFEKYAGLLEAASK